MVIFWDDRASSIRLPEESAASIQTTCWSPRVLWEEDVSVVDGSIGNALQVDTGG